MVNGTRPPTSKSKGSSRPGTGPKLEISGGRPPSRVSTGRANASGRPALGASNALQALTHTLIKKMREKFGEAAGDIRSQEAIAEEVQRFMTVSQSVKEDDLSNLEERIRRRLTGDTPMRNDLVSAKQLADKADEWAKIWKYTSQKGLLEEEMKKDLARKRQQEIKDSLDAQIREREERLRAEKSDDEAYANAEKEAIRLWEKEEEAKRKKKHDIMERLKEQRREQLEDRRQRREAVMTRKQLEEEELINKLARETKQEMEKEESLRQKGKAALKEFLLSNEVNKKLKEEQKQKEAAEDLAYTKAYTEMLEKQELARQAQLEKLKTIQARQEQDAQERPPAKRWIDPDIIEKHYNKREAELKAEDERRQNAVITNNQKMIKVLEKQREEKKTRAAAMKQIELKQAEDYIKMGKAQEEVEAEKKRKDLQRKIKLRLELEAQMRENAKNRQESQMSETEKKLNKRLLKEVADFEAVGESTTTSWTLSDVFGSKLIANVAALAIMSARSTEMQHSR